MTEIIISFLSGLFSLYILIFIALYLQIIVHEGGHLIFGLMTKYKFLSFRIGNLMIIKTQGTLKFKKFSLAGTGGQCIMIPPDFENGKIPYFLYNAGGALMNFISSIIAFAIGTYFKEAYYFSQFIEYFTFFGVAFGLVNIIPFKGKLISNDGKNILSISKNQRSMESFWRMLKVHSLLNDGIRIIDMPEELFIQPSDTDLLNNITAIDGYTYAVRLLEKRELTEAKTYIEYLLNKETALAGLHKALLACELIYINLIIGDFESVDKLLDKKQLSFLKKAKNMLPVLRVQYLLALLKEKDSPRAEKYLMQFEKAAKGYFMPVDAESEYELIEFAKTYTKN